MSSKLLLAFSFMVLLCWRCASIAPPSGGPKDTTPPFLVTASPPSGTVGLLEPLIELIFSEYMDEKSFIDGVRISPVLMNEPILRFQGDKVFLRLPADITSDMTVVVTLSRSIKDEHGVALAAPVQLAYSTGHQIDQALISGHVYSDQPAAVYLFKDTGADSLLLQTPNYITETDDDGFFEFNYLAAGDYKVLAVERGAAGATLDPTRMMFGIPAYDQITVDSLMTGIRIQLHRERQPLRLLHSTWNEGGWGELHFNNPLSENMTFHGLQIGTSALSYFIHPEERTGLVVIPADSIPEGKTTLRILTITEEDEVVMDSVAVNIAFSSRPDTNFLALVSPNETITITPDFSGPPLPVIFSRPVETDLMANQRIQLVRDDSVMVPFKKQVNSPMHMDIIVDQWLAQHQYTLQIFSDPDVAYRETFKDSITVVKITTTRSQGYGGIIGSITGLTTANTIVVLAHAEKPERNFQKHVNSGGHFELMNIPEGFYFLSIFQDQDSSNTYSYGTAYPFQASEWFYTVADTIEIRANWDIELPPIYVEH